MAPPAPKPGAGNEEFRNCVNRALTCTPQKTAVFATFHGLFTVLDIKELRVKWQK
jgi:hypothetical protein